MRNISYFHHIGAMTWTLYNICTVWLVVEPTMSESALLVYMYVLVSIKQLTDADHLKDLQFQGGGR